MYRVTHTNGIIDRIYKVGVSQRIPEDSTEISNEDYQKIRDSGLVASCFRLDGGKVEPSSDQQLIIKRRRLSESSRNLASHKILGAIPLWKQLNLISESVSLLDKVLNGDSLSEEEKTKMQYARDTWEKISDIRAASNNIELIIDAADSLDDFNLETREEWPTT